MAIKQDTFRKRVFNNVNPSGAKNPRKLSEDQASTCDAAFGVMQDVVRQIERKHDKELSQCRENFSSLKVELNQARADTRLEQERIGFLSMMLSNGVSSTAKFLVRPWTDSLGKLASNPVPRLVNDAGNQQTSSDVLDGVLSDQAVSKKEASPITKNEDEVTNKDADRRQKSEPAQPSEDRDLLEGTNGPLNWTVRLLANTFGRLTPLTTAIVFLLTITVIGAVGKYYSSFLTNQLAIERSDHTESKKLLTEANKQIDSLETAARQRDEVVIQRDALNADVKRLNEEIARLQSKYDTTVATHRQEVSNLMSGHEKELELARTDADAQLIAQSEKQREDLRRLNEEMNSLADKNTELDRQLRLAQTEFSDTGTELVQANARIETLSSDLLKTRKTLREANEKYIDLSAFSSQFSALLPVIQNAFGENSLQLIKRRGCFHIQFKEIIRGLGPLAKEYSIPEQLQLGRFDMPGESWNFKKANCPGS